MVGGLSAKDIAQHFHNENQTETKPFHHVVRFEEAGWNVVIGGQPSLAGVSLSSLPRDQRISYALPSLTRKYGVKVMD